MLSTRHLTISTKSATLGDSSLPCGSVTKMIPKIGSVVIISGPVFGGNTKHPGIVTDVTDDFVSAHIFPHMSVTYWIGTMPFSQKVVKGTQSAPVAYSVDAVDCTDEEVDVTFDAVDPLRFRNS